VGEEREGEAEREDVGESKTSGERKGRGGSGKNTKAGVWLENERQGRQTLIWEKIEEG
jgi:hypothetical protein